MLSAYNSDMREEVFIVLRNGELILYIEAIEVMLRQNGKHCMDRVKVNMLIKHKVIESLGMLNE